MKPAGLNNGSSIRVFYPSGTKEPVKTTSGKLYTPSGSNLYIDIPRPDGDSIAFSNAPTTKTFPLIEIGTTAQRPSKNPGVAYGGLTNGYQYYDTTLSKIIFWSTLSNGWVDVTGTAV